MAFNVAEFARDALAQGYSPEQVLDAVRKRAPQAGGFIDEAAAQGFAVETIAERLKTWGGDRPLGLVRTIASEQRPRERPLVPMPSARLRALSAEAQEREWREAPPEVREAGVEELTRRLAAGPRGKPMPPLLTALQEKAAARRAEGRAAEETRAAWEEEIRRQTGGTAKGAMLRGASEALWAGLMATGLGVAGGAGLPGVGLLGRTALGRALGPWAGPLAEGGWGAAAEGLHAEAMGERPLDVLKAAGRGAAWFGGLPLAARALPEALAGYAAAGRGLARIPAVGRATARAREALAASPLYGRVPGLLERGARAYTRPMALVAARQAKVERGREITEAATAQEAESAERVGRGLKRVAQLTRGAVEEQAAGRLGRRARRELLERAGELESRAMDVPASAMLRMYQDARDTAVARLKDLRRRLRGLQREERRQLQEVARAGVRHPRYMTQARRLAADMRTTQDEIADLEGTLQRIGREEEKYEAVRERDMALREGLAQMIDRMRGRGRAYPLRHDARTNRWVRAGRPQGYVEAGEVDELAAQVGMAPERLLDRIREAALKRGAAVERYEVLDRGTGRPIFVKDFGQVELGVTQGEMRAALRTLREEAGLVRERAPRASTTWGGASPAERARLLRAGGYEAPKARDRIDPEDVISTMPVVERPGGGKGARGEADLRHLVAVLKGPMYQQKASLVGLREMVQNSLDALMGSGERGRVSVRVDVPSRTIAVADNGIGMTPKVAYDEFLSIAGSFKPLGGRGDFGFGKVSYFGNADRIHVVSVMDRPRGGYSQRMLTELEGTGEQWLSPEGLTVVREVPAPRDVPGGTTVTVQLSERVSMQPWRMRGWLSQFLENNRLPHQFEFTVDGTPAAARQRLRFYDLAKRSVEGAEIEVLASREVAASHYVRYEVLNQGMPQFTGEAYISDAMVDVPQRVLVDVRPLVNSEHNAYPFTTDRGALRGAAKSAVEQVLVTDVRQAGAIEIARRLQQHYHKALDLPETVVRPGGKALQILETTGAAGLHGFAQSARRSRALSRVADAMATVFEPLRRRVRRIYGDESRPVRFAGIAVGPQYQGVHVNHKIMYLEGTPEAARNAIWMNPLQIQDAVLRDLRDGLLDEAHLHQHYSEAMVEVMLHELVHTVVPTEGGGTWTATYTRLSRLMRRELNKAADDLARLLEDVRPETRAAGQVWYNQPRNLFGEEVVGRRAGSMSDEWEALYADYQHTVEEARAKGELSNVIGEAVDELAAGRGGGGRRARGAGRAAGPGRRLGEGVPGEGGVPPGGRPPGAAAAAGGGEARPDLTRVAWKDLPAEAQQALAKALRAERRAAGAEELTPAQMARRLERLLKQQAGQRERVPGAAAQAAKYPLAKEARQTTVGQMRAARQGIRELGWAASARTRQRTFPAEADEAAQAAKYEAGEQVWAEAEQAGWKPKALRLLRMAVGTVAEAEDLLGRELVDTGLLSAPAYRRWQGVHLRRIVPYYRGDSMADLMNWLETHSPQDLPRLARLELRMRQGERLRGLGRAPLTIPSAIRRPRRVIGAELPEYLGAQLVPFAERHRAGAALASRAVARARAIRQIATEFEALNPRQFEKLAGAEPAIARRYALMPQGPSWGELSGMYLEKPIRDLLVEWDRVPTVGERLMGVWKSMKVPLSWAASFHNLACNKLMASIRYGVGPFLPENYLAAIHELRNNAGLWAQARRVYPLAGGSWQRAEIGAALRALGASAEVGGVRGLMERLEGLAGRGLQRASEPYGAMEVLDKWACARWDHLVRGTPLRQAMQRADEALINYGRVPSFVLKARRSPWGLPFMTFPYAVATRLMPKWVRENPGKLWAMYRAPETLTYLPARHDPAARARINLERAVMAAWNESRLMIRLPWTAGDGAGLWVDLSRFLPFSDVLEAALLGPLDAVAQVARGGGPPAGQELVDIPLSAVSPALSAPAELTAIAVYGQERGRRGYREIPEPGPWGRPKAMARYTLRMALPGALWDAFAVAYARGPSMEQPYRRSRALEAIRALGVPIVRVRPDLEYDRALQSLAQELATAARQEALAKTGTQRRYWRWVARGARDKQGLLMSLPPPPSGKRLPSERLEEAQALRRARAAAGL